jgi:hypothetical protein
MLGGQIGHVEKNARGMENHARSVSEPYNILI